jgi:O-antigen/teichoic acid export membrane protein
LLKIENPLAIWMTMLVVLTSLLLPVFRGILQGEQNFMGMGWVAICDGLGRFIAVCVIVLLLSGRAAGAMTGAFLGQIGALAFSVWWTRDILQGVASSFRWRNWFGKLVPLTLGFGTLLFLQSTDAIYVQSIFSKDDSAFYMAPALIGFALVQFTGPLVAVMFPKIVSSVARSENTDALKLTFGTTALVGVVAAIVCTIVPWLPLRILYFAKPELLKSAPLVPWFVWCMLFTTLANVLIGNLLARQKFKIVPWLVVVAIGYGVALYLLKDHLKTLPAFVGFKRVVQTLGAFNFALLVIATWFSWHKKPIRAANPAAVAAR